MSVAPSESTDRTKLTEPTDRANSPTGAEAMPDISDLSEATASLSLGMVIPERREPRAGGAQDTSRSTCSTTRSEYGRRDPSKRVAGRLGLDQEEVLIALMFDDFMATGMQSLDYDRVVRNAVTIQSDPDVCKVLGLSPMPIDECWVPPDDWITDMCFAFSSTEQQLTARSYPEHDITPPAMTMLVDRGSEKRTGIKARRALRPKPAGGGGSAAAVTRAMAASQPPPEQAAPSAMAPEPAAPAAAGTSRGEKSHRSKGKGKRNGSPAKSNRGPSKAEKSHRSGADDAALLNDPRPKPTGSKSKAR